MRFRCPIDVGKSHPPNKGRIIFPGRRWWRRWRCWHATLRASLPRHGRHSASRTFWWWPFKRNGNEARSISSMHNTPSHALWCCWHHRHILRDGRWQIDGARCACRHGRRCSRSVVGRPHGRTTLRCHASSGCHATCWCAVGSLGWRWGPTQRWQWRRVSRCHAMLSLHSYSPCPCGLFSLIGDIIHVRRRLVSGFCDNSRHRRHRLVIWQCAAGRWWKC